ncbi:MAG: 3-deoxy-manno-octulosonate cytidylyltransferase [bacterium]|nr:3-deoxy-manno-octulosonate cytidylyltransferase [bacterium]
MNSADNASVLAIIPARFASTRFPGKAIAPLAGKPLVAHTYERTCQSKLVSDVVIATEDQRVVDALAPHGIDAVLTRADHPSGTDRIAEVAENSNADIIVNVQGDEPLIDPHTIDACIRPLLDDPELPMSTAKGLITTPEELANPDVVKVVCDARDRALYFSRHAIPYVRDPDKFDDPPRCHWVHIGLYVYRRDFLLEYAKWPQTPLEQLESLEQLRALERGYPIAVVETEYESIGVDRPDDLERVREIIERALEGQP